jgi:single-stranded DNA-binding protein
MSIGRVYLNRINLLGSARDKPETSVAGNGEIVTRLLIGTHKRCRSNGGGWEIKTQLHTCVVYGGKSAEYAARIPVGATVFVEGELSYGECEREIEGLMVKWPVAEIIVSSISAIPQRGKAESGAAA